MVPTGSTVTCPTCHFSFDVSKESSACPASSSISSLLHCPGSTSPLRTYSSEDILVLLYYSYVLIEDVGAAVEWHRQLCSHLDLRGRLRITPEGVNSVLDGERMHVEAFMDVVAADGRWGEGIEFKVGGLNKGKPAEQQRFRRLLVQKKDEVVSLGLMPGAAAPEHTAVHLSPEEWHEKILSAARRKGEQGEVRDVVLLDTRNSYESRIGRFECEGVETLVPDMRQFTDFPHFVDQNIEKLRGKTVMMYCTGGVRCERASSFLKERLAEETEGGVDMETDVFQLRGGVHAYLRDFAGKGREGVFAGKNFVFDPRRHEPIFDPRVVGVCHSCKQPHDDYDNGAECRCKHCRVLLLLCDECRSSREWPVGKNGCIQELACGGSTCSGTIGGVSVSESEG